MTIYYLYIKTHNKTGLKYLGQTKRKDPHKYPGSGKYWQSHLKTHGKDYTTEILHECQSVDELREKGLHYSQLWDVVKSNDWANLKEESGEGGFSLNSIQCSERNKRNWNNPEYRAKQMESRKKLWADPEHQIKMDKVRKRAYTAESRAKISEFNRKRSQDPEYRARLSETIKKRAQDPVVRAKASEAAKKMWANPEYRAKRCKKT